MTARWRAGLDGEARTAAWLESAGWDVCQHGQRLWDPSTDPDGRAGVLAAVRGPHRYPIRWAPDLLAGKQDRPPLLVEVTGTQNGYTNRALELAKVVALDAWSHVAPVLIVDDVHGTAWLHSHYRWPGHVVRPTVSNGSGEPFVLYPPELPGEHPLDEWFR